MHNSSEMILPRASRHVDSSPPKSPERFIRYSDKYQDSSPEVKPKYDEPIVRRYEAPKYRNYNLNENGVKLRGPKCDEFDEEDEFKERNNKGDVGRSNRSKYSQEDVRYYQEDYRPKYDDYYQQSDRYYDDKINSKYYQDYNQDNSKYLTKERYYKDTKTLEKNSRFYQDSRHPENSPRTKFLHEEQPRGNYIKEDQSRTKYLQEHFNDSRRRPEERQRSPTPPENVSPRDRFKDAKKKFLLLEQERVSHSQKDKAFLKRHESMIHHKERYHEDRRFQPKPLPRSLVEDESRYLERYRRSTGNQLEEEHKRNSAEIAKELKRRSYMEYYREVPEQKRYPALERDIAPFSKSNAELDKIGDKYSKGQKLKQPAGYRHSYAEAPKLPLDKIGKKHCSEMVHRTNSSVSNSGRVGLASVTPY